MQRNTEYMYTITNTRQKDKKWHLYQSQSTLQLQQFRLQNEVVLSRFLSKCTEHVVFRKTEHAVVTLQQKKRL